MLSADKANIKETWRQQKWAARGWEFLKSWLRPFKNYDSAVQWGPGSWKLYESYLEKLLMWHSLVTGKKNTPGARSFVYADGIIISVVIIAVNAGIIRSRRWGPRPAAQQGKKLFQHSGQSCTSVRRNLKCWVKFQINLYHHMAAWALSERIKDYWYEVFVWRYWAAASRVNQLSSQPICLDNSPISWHCVSVKTDVRWRRGGGRPGSAAQ